MRAKGRNQGCFASLSGLKKLTPPPGSLYPLLIVDAKGLPVFFLCEWYRRKVERDPGRTAATYLDILSPWAAFLLHREFKWNDSPDRVRAYLIEFLRQDVACNVAPDGKHEDALYVDTTGNSPLSKSSLGVLLAALTSLYDELGAGGYYPYPNPLRSDKMVALKREHIRQVKSAGAPDHAGTRGESWQQTNRAFPTNRFRQRRGKIWSPEVVLEPDEAQECMCKTIDYMAQHATFLRDRVIFLLLRQTGARLSEVLEMTVGGYRAAHHAGRALVKNKGSRGREEKLIHFTTSIDATLVKYIRTERARYDPQGRKRLEDLNDHDPLFLTRRGKPYHRPAFYHHWNRLFAPAQHQFKKEEQVEFTAHDLRHLRVTRTVTKLRREAKGDRTVEAQLLEGFNGLMGWQSPETITTYLKTMNKRQAIKAVLDDEEAVAHQQEQDAVTAQSKAPSVQTQPLCTEKDRSSDSVGAEPAHLDDNDELSWYEE